MRLLELCMLYLACGIVAAIAIVKMGKLDGRAALWNAALAIPLWPLWAPIALSRATPKRTSPTAAGRAALSRIEAALREGVEAARGTPLESLLSPESAERLHRDVSRAAERESELTQLLVRPGFDEADAERKLAQLEAERASPRSLATARVHLENVRRLRMLRARDATALAELADLVEALRTQLVLARYAGSTLEGVGDVVTEVWARVEGLAELHGEVSEGLPIESPKEATP